MDTGEEDMSGMLLQQSEIGSARSAFVASIAQHSGHQSHRALTHDVDHKETH
jgi:hypothetical protein